MKTKLKQAVKSKVEKKCYLILKGIFNLCLFLLVCIACEKEQPKVNYTVSGTVEIEDIHHLPSTQKVEFGVFDINGYSIVERTAINQSEDNSFQFEVEVQEGEYLFKLFISENSILKSDVHIFNETALSKNIQLESGSHTILTYNRIQQQLFNRCTQCHGGSNDIAAGLNLTEGNSYANLVGVSAKNADKMRVVAGNSDESFILQVLTKNNLSFDHSASTSATDGDIELIKTWINEGAKND